MTDSHPCSGSQASGPISQSVDRLRREFDRWLDAMMQQGNRALDVVGLRGLERPSALAVDVMETPTEVHVDVDLPGVEPGLVDVSLMGNMLTIQVPRKPSVVPEGAVSHLAERAHAPSQRSIPMPASVVAESVTAEIKNGVLRLRLQKSDKARAQKIPIRTESPFTATVDPTIPRTPYNTGL